LTCTLTGYTVLEGSGSWKGMKESSILIEIDGTTSAKVRSAADAIKRLNKQQAVLVQRHQAESILV
jgi:hypothetical protein